MSAIALRPSDLTRRMAVAGMAALIVALAVELPQFEANKQAMAAHSALASVPALMSGVVISSSAEAAVRLPAYRSLHYTVNQQLLR